MRSVSGFALVIGFIASLGSREAVASSLACEVDIHGTPTCADGAVTCLLGLNVHVCLPEIIPACSLDARSP